MEIDEDTRLWNRVGGGKNLAPNCFSSFHSGSNTTTQEEGVTEEEAAAAAHNTEEDKVFTRLFDTFPFYDGLRIVFRCFPSGVRRPAHSWLPVVASAIKHRAKMDR